MGAAPGGRGAGGHGGRGDRLVPGDPLFIPAGTTHRVTFTDPDRPTIWLAIHLGETGMPIGT